MVSELHAQSLADKLILVISIEQLYVDFVANPHLLLKATEQYESPQLTVRSYGLVKFNKGEMVDGLDMLLLRLPVGETPMSLGLHAGFGFGPEQQWTLSIGPGDLLNVGSSSLSEAFCSCSSTPA
jgi:hypothetical protein